MIKGYLELRWPSGNRKGRSKDSQRSKLGPNIFELNQIGNYLPLTTSVRKMRGFRVLLVGYVATCSVKHHYIVQSKLFLLLGFLFQSIV